MYIKLVVFDRLLLLIHAAFQHIAYTQSSILLTLNLIYYTHYTTKQRQTQIKDNHINYCMTVLLPMAVLVQGYINQCCITV